jgi:hypothetical protein
MLQNQQIANNSIGKCLEREREVLNDLKHLTFFSFWPAVSIEVFGGGERVKDVDGAMFAGLQF